MAKVKSPLMSQEARGGINGFVYNTWRGISYVKTNTSPTGQGTPLRLAAQALLVTVSLLWRSITTAQRAAWSAYAAAHPVSDWTGNPKRLTGANWYTKCNINLDRIGQAMIEDPPAAPAPAAPVGLALTKDTTNLQVAWTTPSDAGTYVVTHLQGPHSVGLQGRLEQAKFLAAEVSSGGAAHTILALATYGQYTIFARCVHADTGLASPWVSATFLMT